MNILIHKVSRIKRSLEKLLDDDLDMMVNYEIYAHFHFCGVHSIVDLEFASMFT